MGFIIPKKSIEIIVPQWVPTNRFGLSSTQVDFGLPCWNVAEEWVGRRGEEGGLLSLSIKVLEIKPLQNFDKIDSRIGIDHGH